MYLEYPKHVYQGEGEDRVSRLVRDADEEAAAAAEGFAALPSAPPAEIARQHAGVPHLEYPKLLFRGDDDPLCVSDADGEAAARAAGYVGAGEAVTPASDTPDSASAEEAPKRKRRG